MTEPAPPRPETPFSVLHVCTGNIGRSPMAEYLMRASLYQRIGGGAREFLVASAGTWGCEGSGMEPFALLTMAERGLDADQLPLVDFRARELTEELLSSADLVLTATTEHRAHVVGLVPAVVRRTFTLKEFARIAEALKETSDNRDNPDAPDSRGAFAEGNEVGDRRERALAWVRTASQFRGMAPRPDPGQDDVEDPLGAPKAIYEERADEIQRACLQALDLLLSARH